MKPSTGAAVRLHRNAVRDRPDSLSAFKWNACPPSPESALIAQRFLILSVWAAALRGLGAIWRNGYRYKKAGVMLLALVRGRYGWDTNRICRSGPIAAMEAAPGIRAAALYDTLGRTAQYLIPACGDIDSSAPPFAPEQGANIPQRMSRCGLTQRESGSASFGIRLSFCEASCRTQACPAALSRACQHSGAPPPDDLCHKAFGGAF